MFLRPGRNLLTIFYALGNGFSPSQQYPFLKGWRFAHTKAEKNSPGETLKICVHPRPNQWLFH
jgi:hypothetical protein